MLVATGYPGRREKEEPTLSSVAVSAATQTKKTEKPRRVPESPAEQPCSPSNAVQEAALRLAQRGTQTVDRTDEKRKSQKSRGSLEDAADSSATRRASHSRGMAGFVERTAAAAFAETLAAAAASSSPERFPSRSFSRPRAARMRPKKS